MLASGFGAFEQVQRNASGEVALALAARPPRGWRVRSGVLPVSFRRAPDAWDELRTGLGAERPAFLLALGVHKEPGFRIELRARPRVLRADRPDVDGAVTPADGPELATSLPVGRRARELSELESLGAGRVWVSRDRGGYVCERIYHHVLGRSLELGVPALFVHV